MTIEELATEYVNMFGENVPFYAISNVSEEAVLVLIKKALDTGEPIKPEYQEGMDY